MSRRKVYWPTIAAAMVLAGAIAVGEPFTDGGSTYVYSGRTGKLLYRFDGASGDYNGFSMADAGDAFGWSVSSAGDVNRDGRTDVLIGTSEAFSGAGPGYAQFYSGRSYALLRTLIGDTAGDQFGSGAGWTRDVNRDGVPDQIVGARDAGVGARGQVYVYSGKTGGRLLTIDASPHGDSLGSFFVAGIGDVNRDGTPDIYARPALPTRA